LRKPRPKRAPLPTRARILAFIAESPEPVGKREIARAFHIRGDQRVALKAMLREIADEGLVERGRRRRMSRPGHLPPVAVVEISGVDDEGTPLARPLNWNGADAPPVISVIEGRRAGPALGVGDRVLARLARLAPDRYEARPIRRLARGPGRLLGVYRQRRGEGRVVPTERRARTEFTIDQGDDGGARSGELVLAEVLPGRRLGLPRAKIVERLGASITEPAAIGRIVVHAHGIAVDFPGDALDEAARARPVTALDGRADLRDLPLVTIDGADARDFDDAVWAEPDPATPGAWHAIVAIADVAHYVRPGGALDRAAYRRANSVYLPDRAIPMLPEALSTDLCSLKPGVDRPCLAVHLWIGPGGALRRHRFERALMRSAARLTYAQVEAAHEGRPDAASEPLVETVLAPLYGVHAALRRARTRRGTLDLDLPERQVIFNDEGHIAAIRPRARLASHRLIEELMIAANVAAAETLEARREAVMYRVHDAPSVEKLVELRQFLAELGHRLKVSARAEPRQLDAILREVAALPHAPAVNTAILRAQAQAEYRPLNIGHFGLNLRRYSHFTSPIRRYADLLVHRALIRGLGLGAGGLPAGAEAEFEAIGAHLSTTERRAAAAEREAMERFIAVFMAEKVGASFAARVSGATRFGLFVALDETGAEGLVPRRDLSAAFAFDERRREFIGPDRAIRMGDPVEVRLRAAEIETGGLLFELIDGGSTRPPKGRRNGGRGAKRSRR